MYVTRGGRMKIDKCCWVDGVAALAQTTLAYLLTLFRFPSPHATFFLAPLPTYDLPLFPSLTLASVLYCV